MDPNIKELVEEYQRTKEALLDYRRETFPPETIVLVNCDQYKGLGVCVADGLSNPDQVSVRLGNGNTWWYHIEACQPVSKT